MAAAILRELRGENMNRKIMLAVAVLFIVVLSAACTPAAPQAAQEAPAAEAAPTEAPAEETVAESADAGDDAATYAVDNAASVVEWYGSKPIGASEAGTVAIAEGALSFAGSELVDGQVVIDMTTIETTSQSGDMANMLVGHLSSDDFFGVETYPTANLVIKSAQPTGEEGQYAVVADLTIKETTEEIEFVTDVVVGEGTIEATADIVVDRSIYDVRYNSGTFFSDLGDDLISDEMELTVKLVAGL
jgi:polyisoprenoid-binding protein YceI